MMTVDRLFAEATDAQRIAYRLVQSTSREIRRLHADSRTAELFTLLCGHPNMDQKAIRDLVLAFSNVIEEAVGAFVRRETWEAGCRSIVNELTTVIKRLRELPGLRLMSSLERAILAASSDRDSSFRQRLE